MVRLTQDEYARLKAFLGVWDARFLHELTSSLPPPEIWPSAVLERLEQMSMAKARAGLLMAVNDIVEMTLSWPQEKVALTDAELTASLVPTLSELRARYAQRLSRVFSRGAITTDVEYYLAKGVLDGAPDALDASAQATLADLLVAYEEKRGAP